MPATTINIFVEDDDTAPFLKWFDDLPQKVQDKCRVRLERLAEMGQQLRRPEADFLRDGIYELRVKHHRVNYRILYFFQGSGIAVISHGLQKENAVPATDIDRAVERKKRFAKNPERHTFTGELADEEE